MAYTDIDKPSDYFNTVLYTGNGGTLTVSGVGFQSDFTWLKGRSFADYHVLTDSVRGVNSQVYSNDVAVQGTQTNGITSFNSDGFVLGNWSNTNKASQTHVAWNWKAETSFTNDASATGIGSIDSVGSFNNDAGFSIVSYTGTGSVGTIKHGLNSAPKIMITKSRSGARNWITYTTAIDGSMDYLYLNLTDAKGNSSASVPTSSIVNLTNGAEANASSENFIMYCFAEKKGYSKFGSYTGNGNADGTFVYTGFKPAFVMIKRSDASGYYWNIIDNARDVDNPVGLALFPNVNEVEYNYTNFADFYSNGFKLRHTSNGSNASGGTYIFMCFAENPFTTSTGVPATAR
jgi:hypothetical protein